MTKVICIEIGESLYKNKGCIKLELNKVYNISPMSHEKKCYYIMRDDMRYGHFFSKEYFMTLSEFREQRINKILND